VRCGSGNGSGQPVVCRREPARVRRLLSAHFQGFCRDLYAEAAQVITFRVRQSLQVLVQDQFVAHCGLDHKNATLDTLAGDFNRFGLDLRRELAADPADQIRRQHLAALNLWRNVAAHWGRVAHDRRAVDLASDSDWQQSCDGLATVLDGIVYNRLRKLLRRKPW